MSSNSENHQQPQGEIDPTSFVGHPEYVSPAAFAVGLPGAELAHNESPEEVVEVISYQAIGERGKGRRFGQGATFGIIGMGLGLGGKAILGAMESDMAQNLETLQTVTDHATSIAMILGGCLVISSTARREFHEQRARRAQDRFEQTVRQNEVTEE